MSHIRSFWDAICLSTLRKRLEKCVSPGGGFNNFIGMAHVAGDVAAIN